MHQFFFSFFLIAFIQLLFSPSLFLNIIIILNGLLRFIVRVCVHPIYTLPFEIYISLFFFSVSFRECLILYIYHSYAIFTDLMIVTIRWMYYRSDVSWSFKLLYFNSFSIYYYYYYIVHVCTPYNYYIERHTNC